MRYLDVECDRSLAFTEHVDHVMIKARMGVAVMSVIAALNCK
jgi:hypothetical protein